MLELVFCLPFKGLKLRSTVARQQGNMDFKMVLTGNVTVMSVFMDSVKVR